MIINSLEKKSLKSFLETNIRVNQICHFVADAESLKDFLQSKVKRDLGEQFEWINLLCARVTIQPSNHVLKRIDCFIAVLL